MAGTEAIISIMKQSGAKDWAFDYSVNFDDFNNISVISWLSVLLVEEIGVPRENHRPVATLFPV
jgi:hypothetical protein